MSDPYPTPGRAAPAADFVGRGFAWPFGVDHTGAIALTEGTGDVEDSMRVVLLTAPGERVMRPAFGCRIWELLFEPITPNLVGLVRQAVRDALARWEPRVEVEDVRPVQDAVEPGLLRIAVDYRVRSTNDRRNLVFPFYVIPREDS